MKRDMKKKEPLFKIVPNSIVKGDSIGHLVCETIPEHPQAMHLKDRKKRYVLLHRVLLENHLGHLIDTNKYEIHHKDENPTNNAISNLQLTDSSNHQKEHSRKRKFWKKSPMNKPNHKLASKNVIKLFLGKNRSWLCE